jgi:hypothetical protein
MMGWGKYRPKAPSRSSLSNDESGNSMTESLRVDFNNMSEQEHIDYEKAKKEKLVEIHEKITLIEKKAAINNDGITKLLGLSNCDLSNKTSKKFTNETEKNITTVSEQDTFEPLIKFEDSFSGFSNQP